MLEIQWESVSSVNPALARHLEKLPEGGDAKNTPGMRKASAGLHALLNTWPQSRFTSSAGSLNGINTYCGDTPSDTPSERDKYRLRWYYPAGWVPAGPRAPRSSPQPSPMWSALPMGASLQRWLSPRRGESRTLCPVCCLPRAVLLRHGIFSRSRCSSTWGLCKYWVRHPQKLLVRILGFEEKRFRSSPAVEMPVSWETESKIFCEACHSITPLFFINQTQLHAAPPISSVCCLLARQYC